MATKVFGLDLGKTRQGIAGGLGFWADAVRATLPRGLRNNLTVGKEQVLVQVHTDKLHVIEHENDKTTNLGEFDYDKGLLDSAVFDVVKKHAGKDKTLILAVADQHILSKKVDFPVAVADNLKQTLRYEMDKHTPFPADDVLFDTEILGETSGKILANLHILHKPSIDDLLTRFAENHVHFHLLTSVSNQNINLLPPHLAKKQSLFGFNINGFLLLLCGLLAVVALATPLALKRHTAIALDKQIATLTPQADGEIELWERRDQSEEALLNFLDTHPVSFSQVYEELSKLLPDHTYLHSFDYRNNRITIRGESADAAALIRVINASPLFKNAKVLSPIVKSRTSNKEAYQIGFELISGQGQS